ncbi:ThuA domain-containing protein [Deinococcus sonorensis]|uniref:ThuA domain-containing protein n=2 Tax=Deinococcus sonorensis TaxID=309891 RepID=A0AAU7UGE5_9DEIO
MSKTIQVTVWNEFRHEQKNEKVKAIYPDGMHAVIAQALREGGFEVGTATLDEPQHGLTDEVLARTDVLFWWGHLAHGEVADEVVERVYARVLAGMGLVVLHSGHFSKIFKRLMGTSCDLKWREADDRERLWVVAPGHPVAAGLGESIVLEREEMYGEHFDIPEPDELVFVSWFSGGEVFRSGASYRRGAGRIFYFRPGHETYPTYHNPEIQRVLVNAAGWAAPTPGTAPVYGNAKPVEGVQP